MDSEKEYSIEVEGEIREELAQMFLSVARPSRLGPFLMHPDFMSDEFKDMIRQGMIGGPRSAYIKLKDAKGFKVEIFSNEHPPPHVRVKIGGASANYRIDNGERMTPSRELERFDREIQKLLQKNKSALIAEWNERRPSDCPVGLYRE